MNALQLSLIHFKVFALVGLSIYAALVVRNACRLFVIPWCSELYAQLSEWRLGEWRWHQISPESPVSMPGRTQPLNDFLTMLHDRDADTHFDPQTRTRSTAILG